MHRRTAVALTLLAIVAGSLAACGTPSPGASPSGDGSPILGGVSSEPSGGGSPSGGASPTPGGSGSPSPTISRRPTPVPTAHSTLASKAGFVWSYNPSASYSPTGQYQFNSAGGAINITRSAVGRYIVSFMGLGGPGGVAHAQAYGGTANYCNVSYWNGNGGNQNIAVDCYTPAGAYSDTLFVANWAAGSQDTARFGYLWAEQATNPLYHPHSAYRYDAVDSAAMTVRRLSTGRYRVHIPSSAPVDEPVLPWAYQVTAYATTNLCKLHSVDRVNANAVVACRTPAGANADSRFAISYHNIANMLGRQDRRFDISGQGLEPAIYPISNPSTGIYVATLSAMGPSQGHVVSLATGTTATYCHVSSWADSSGDLKATTVCFNPGGTAASSGFLVSATW